MVFGLFGVCWVIPMSVLSFLFAAKVDLVAIVMEIYGLLFLIVWCGIFGRKEIVGVLKTTSFLCLISSFYFQNLVGLVLNVEKPTFFFKFGFT